MRRGEWRFSEDLGSATHAGRNVEVAFTRAERRLLQALLEQEGRVLSRDRLLDAVSGSGSEAFDRSIDFLVNRLRRKLGDSARRPRYLATRYGEGYVWIAEPPPAQGRAEAAALLIGPAHGVPAAREGEDAAWAFLRGLHARIDRETGAHAVIALDAEAPPAERFEGPAPEFSLAVSFVALGDGRLDAALTLRRFKLGSVVAVWRVRIRADAPDDVGAEIVAAIVAAMWRERRRVAGAPAAPEDPPLPVRLIAAADFLAAGGARWREAEARLRETLARAPEDVEARVMLAVALHSKYVLEGPLVLRGADPRARDEAEMEALLLAALPHLPGDDLLSLAAAKLLWFLRPRHRRLALDLAERAFLSTTGLSTAYATLGQLRMWSGRIAEGVELFDRGLELAPPGAEARLYFLVLKQKALAALGDDAAAERVAARLVRDAPELLGLMALLHERRDDPEAEHDRAAMLTRLGPAEARSTLLWLHYVGAQPFASPEARRRVMRRPVEVLTEAFGPQVVPAEVRLDAPPSPSRAMAS